MYVIHGFNFAPNTFKTVVVAEQLGIDYEFVVLDVKKKEHKTEEHLARHFLGKVPTLTHNGKTLFESGAICRYLAESEGSDLYPARGYERAIVDQWMDFFSVHLGRWMNTLYFERLIKPKIGWEVNPETLEEAMKFASAHAKALNGHFTKSPFLAGEKLSIADLFAYAYLRPAAQVEFSLSDYPKCQAWFEALADLPAAARAREMMVD